jgi:O-antigen ligase
MSHTHNAWIDTALAIGIPGAILLLLVMLNYAFYGYQLNQQQKAINPFAFALLISACVWILRGALDSTLRDQMLEMQAFTLAFLLATALQFQTTRSLNK